MRESASRERCPPDSSVREDFHTPPNATRTSSPASPNRQGGRKQAAGVAPPHRTRARGRPDSPAPALPNARTRAHGAARTLLKGLALGRLQARLGARQQHAEDGAKVAVHLPHAHTHAHTHTHTHTHAHTHTHTRTHGARIKARQGGAPDVRHSPT